MFEDELVGGTNLWSHLVHWFFSLLKRSTVVKPVMQTCCGEGDNYIHCFLINLNCSKGDLENISYR